MRIDELGWRVYVERAGVSAVKSIDLERVARVVTENRTNYELVANRGDLTGVVRGKAHYALEADDLPKVGDWVTFSEEQGNTVAIESILPRITKLSRIRAGEVYEEQVMVANVDQVFIVQGLDGNFNVNRLERYLVMVEGSGAQPIVLLNKADLVERVEEYVDQVTRVAPHVPVLAISATKAQATDTVYSHLAPSSTSVFVGSSGVGKSTLLNHLLGDPVQETQSVRDDDQGKHTTTRRELFVLPNGAIIIDTPGMRELNVGSAHTMHDTFSDIEALAHECQFRDCDHERTSGCALTQATERGEVDAKRVANYLKLAREIDFERGKTDKEYGVLRRARIRKTQKGYKKIFKAKYDSRDHF